MPKLLAIDVSPRGEFSKSRALTADFIDEWKAKHLYGEVRIRDLNATELPFVDKAWTIGVNTPAQHRTEEMNAALAMSDELIAELKWADHVLISTPMHNFTVPARLKAWLDQVIRINETFTPTYEGLLTGKKVTALVISAGNYEPGAPFANLNLVVPVLATALNMIGIKDINFILAGKTAAVDLGQMDIDTYRKTHRATLKAAV
jgi:FMN-dependent NADH-azoreductase